jgi:hypothetical protein
MTASNDGTAGKVTTGQEQEIEARRQSCVSQLQLRPVNFFSHEGKSSNLRGEAANGVPSIPPVSCWPTKTSLDASVCLGALSAAEVEWGCARSNVSHSYV